MKLAVGVLFLIAIIVVGVAVVPPYWANYQLQDAIKNEALISTNSAKSEDAIRDSVYKKVKELEIPIDKEAIKVTRVGSQGVGSVTIDVTYDVPVSLPGYSFDLHFDANTTNKGVF